MSEEPKVLLTLEEGEIIVAKRFSYVAGERMGISARCDDGSQRLLAVSSNPTNAELYEIRVAANASYEEKVEAIKPVLEELDDRGEDVPDTSTLEQINEWLNAEAAMDEYQMEEWAGRASQYAVGYAILDALTFDEQRALGMREADLGGPASSVPCVSTSASLEDLNRVLASKRLPFLFIDDQGPEEQEG